MTTIKDIAFTCYPTKKLKENNVKIYLDIQKWSNCSMAMVNDQDGNVIILHQKNS